jgi:hypothetical protein
MERSTSGSPQPVSEMVVAADVIGLVVDLIRKDHHHRVGREIMHFVPDHRWQLQCLIGPLKPDFRPLLSIVQQDGAGTRNRDGPLVQTAMRMKAATDARFRSEYVIDPADGEGQQFTRFYGHEQSALVTTHRQVDHSAASNRQSEPPARRRSYLQGSDWQSSVWAKPSDDVGKGGQ